MLKIYWMKKTTLTVLFFILILNSFSQSTTTSKSLAIYGSARLVFEKPISEHSSISLITSYSILKTSDVNYKLYGIGTEYRFYFAGTAPQGFYAGTGIGYSVGNAKIVNSELIHVNAKTNAGGIIGHLVIGNQWIFENGLLLNINLGAHYFNLGFEKGSTEFVGVKPFGGIMPGIGICIGFKLKSSGCGN